MQDKKLALFFTTDMSLKIWNDIGNLEREVKPYNLLAKHFEKIYFITYGNENELRFKEKLEKNIDVLPKKLPLSSKIYQFLIPLIFWKKLKEIDIYKTNQMGASIPAILSKWLYQKELVVRCGYEWLNFLEKQKSPLWKRIIVYLIEKIAYKNANKIILSSKKDKNYVENKFKITSQKIQIIPNSIDIDLFRSLGIHKEKKRICFVGRLTEQKNVYNLIKAITGSNIKLVIFGNGPMKSNLEKLAMKLNSKVEFRGNIPNNQLPEELNKSELFILPSIYEGNPKALLEAMACGLPCIATNIEAIREIIYHKKNGYLCETSSKSIMMAIKRVLDDKSLREKISKNAIRTIHENFSLDEILKKELRIYKAL
ncbi:MAG: glycosyltransferase family 4 protein [Candidatus Hodarchaeota archaeon]